MPHCFDIINLGCVILKRDIILLLKYIGNNSHLKSLYISSKKNFVFIISV